MLLNRDNYMKFDDKLLVAQKVFALEKYKKQVMPEVYEYLLAYRQDKNIPYPQTVFNSDLKKYIVEKENVPFDLQDYLGTEVYLAQQHSRTLEEQDYRRRMEAEGYFPLNTDVTYRGKIEFVAKRTMDWFTSRIATTGTLGETDDGKSLFVVPKGKRTRGYYVAGLELAFYKPLQK